MSDSNKICVGIIGGSGLDDPDILKNRRTKSVTDTPFGRPSDDLILGEIEGVACVLLARHGRKHDIMPGNVNYRANIWALKGEGCSHIIATTATGSLQEDIKPGDVVILDGFIDWTRGRKQTFHDGQVGHPAGICHVAMEPAFSQQLRQLLIDTAANLKIDAHSSGTVVTVEGPRFSSKAESLMFRSWGAQLVNMTTVPEVVLAKEAGILYASIALATDYDCWRPTGDSVCVTDALNVFKKNTSKMTRLILGAVPNIAKENWETVISSLNDCIRNSIM